MTIALMYSQTAAQGGHFEPSVAVDSNGQGVGYTEQIDADAGYETLRAYMAYREQFADAVVAAEVDSIHVVECDGKAVNHHKWDALGYKPTDPILAA